jgi:hypothetical protein
MGIRNARSLGDAFEGTSDFDNDDNLASLEEAFEEAAKEAAASLGDDVERDLEFDVRLVISARTHNQNVRTYKVIITPSS